jgi:hypothetical protein
MDSASSPGEPPNAVSVQLDLFCYTDRGTVYSCSPVPDYFVSPVDEFPRKVICVHGLASEVNVFERVSISSDASFIRMDLDFPGFISLCIPNTFSWISPDCFSQWSALSNVVFEADSHVSDLGDNAFFRCSLLPSLFLPESVEHIGQNCFDGCFSLS